MSFAGFSMVGLRKWMDNIMILRWKKETLSELT